jgi:hypothetical protein
VVGEESDDVAALERRQRASHLLGMVIEFRELLNGRVGTVDLKFSVVTNVVAERE